MRCLDTHDPDLLDGRVPRRPVHHLRYRGLGRQRAAPREQGRPHVEGLSQGERELANTLA